MRRWRSLIGIVAIAACNGNNAGNNDGTNAGIQPDEATVLATSLQVEVGDNDVRLVFHITNSSNQPVVLEFGTGQKYDFAVRSSAGSEVWRWSADKMFTQAVETQTIPANGNVTYEARVPFSGTGGFTAIAELKALNHPITQQANFERRPR